MFFGVEKLSLLQCHVYLICAPEQPCYTDSRMEQATLLLLKMPAGSIAGKNSDFNSSFF